MRRRPWSVVPLALALSAGLAAPAVSAQSGAASRYFLLPGVRVGFGSRAPLHDAAGPGGGFAFDAAMVLSFMPRHRERGVWFMTDVGYSYEGSAPRGGHFLAVGGAALWGTLSLSVGLSARAVVGGSHGRFAAGVREALVLSAIGGGIVLEVGHQWLQVDEARHDFRWTVAINPVNLYAMFIGQLIGGIAEGVTRGVLSR